jgi:hypothetical protein
MAQESPGKQARLRVLRNRNAMRMPSHQHCACTRTAKSRLQGRHQVGTARVSTSPSVQCHLQPAALLITLLRHHTAAAKRHRVPCQEGGAASTAECCSSSFLQCGMLHAQQQSFGNRRGPASSACRRLSLADAAAQGGTRQGSASPGSYSCHTHRQLAIHASLPQVQHTQSNKCDNTSKERCTASTQNQAKLSLQAMPAAAASYCIRTENTRRMPWLGREMKRVRSSSGTHKHSKSYATAHC